MGLGEFERIDRFFKPLAAGFPGAYGLADDAAAFAPPPGHDLVVTTDAIVAGVHFLPDDPPADIARKLLRVNLSDLAAKGADPLAYTLLTSLPRELDESWLAAFAAGLGEDQQTYGFHLAGGDSVFTPGPLTLSVTAFGIVPSGRMVRRSGARPGEALFVTGTIGDAALGLRVLQGKLTLDEADAAYLIERYRRPLPRNAFASDLREMASAALDVSDGLVADGGHICETSNVGAVIQADAVPLSAAARAALAQDAGLMGLLLTGGDDYEILFTAPDEACPRIAAAALRCEVPVTRIGHMTDRSDPMVVVLNQGGAPLALPAGGWRHF